MKLDALIVTLFVFAAPAFAQSGTQGAPGDLGAAGEDGKSGSVTLFGFKCAVSPNIEHLKMCLTDGRSVNEPRYNGESIFQAAVKSHDLPMLLTVIGNPDQKNRPDLRVRYTKSQPALNIYELILLQRVFKGQTWEPLQIDEQKLKDGLYVDENQIARLKIILSIETDKEALRQETRDILVHLNESRFNGTPSVQEAIQILTSAMEN